MVTMMRPAESDAFGVIFDMDGVLVDSAEPHFESWRRLGREYGVAVGRGQFSETFGRRNDEIIPMLFGEVSASRLAVLSDRKEEIYRDLVRFRVPAVPGAAELVQSLARDGIAMAIGSSGPRKNIDLVLTEMGIESLIPVVVSASDVTRGKPDPQVFHLAIERLGLPASRCIVVEDAPVGVIAAKAAGAKAVAVLVHHPREAFDGPDLMVGKLSDLTVRGLRELVA